MSNIFHLVNKRVQHMGIHARIKEERERVGITQAELAEAIGSTRRSVINWETDAAQPPAVAVAAMAECGMDVLYILTGQRSIPLEETLKPDEAALLDHYRHLTPEAKTALQATGNALAQSAPTRKAA